MTSPMALPRSQATSASRCWFLHPAERQKKLAAGIVHGHLAMMSIIGMFFQGGLTGSVGADWALYTCSPLRAFECELNVRDPVGDFQRRRQTKLKHGRVSM